MKAVAIRERVPHGLFCLSGVLWGLELVEGKDTPRQRPLPMYRSLGNTVGLLL